MTAIQSVTSQPVNFALAEFPTPGIVTAHGYQAEKRFWEFFTASVRNPHTRRAYFSAAQKFLYWCESRSVALNEIEPMVVAAYVEELGGQVSVPTVKQHLAALRMLFDWLVVGQVMPFNPAASVQSPRQSTSQGKTPVLYADDARLFLDSIDTASLIGKRDLAILSVMLYSFARVGAVAAMKGKDFYLQGHRAFLVLHEKNGKVHKLPAHHKITDAVQEYQVAAEIELQRNMPLFRSFRGRSQVLTDRPLASTDILRMVKRRAAAVNLPSEICNHTFRATGITNYLENKGSLENAAFIANHASTRTTQLYDRRRDEVNQAEIERIHI